MPQTKPKNSRPVDYNINVFINCPFDPAYQKLFRCVVFATIQCGFRARCALEIDDGSQIRIDKIHEIIEACRFAIHDLSRTELDAKHRLPRFNMPLELGLFLGAKRFGNSVQARKVCLILDREPHRYQKFISDIAGQDIRAHRRSESGAISVTRDWLRNFSNHVIPGGRHINQQYARFKRQLPVLCRELKLRPAEMTFNDYTNIVTNWLTTRPVQKA